MTALIPLLARPAPKADYRIPYGRLVPQFGDLWLPSRHGGSRLPLILFFHGGWWRSEYDLSYAAHLCAALKAEQIAVWSIEYRRLGETDGGWPATFLDTAAGFDHAAVLARTFPLDMERIYAMGHSAGAHLAFWNAGRKHIPCDSEIFCPPPPFSPQRVIALAGAVDLRSAIDLAKNSPFAHVQDRIHSFLGGGAADFPQRYQAANPAELLPFQVPQLILQGAKDDQIPPDLPVQFAARSLASGDAARVHIIPEADHFDLVDPMSSAWPAVLDAVKVSIFG